MSKKNKRLCFILMPFKQELKEVYWQAIKPACVKAGFDCLRVDELKGTFNINRKIIEHIFSSDAIVADLTEWNPNVFYEMGVAHTIDNKTIMVTQKKYKLPFDVSTYRCLQYRQTEAGLVKLREDIVESLRSIEEWRQHPSNPVQDFKPHDTFITKSDAKKLETELLNKETTIVTLQQELDNLRSRLAAKRSSRRPPRASLQGQLRSLPLDSLTVEDVQKMLRNKSFFDSNHNKTGAGLLHKYEVVERDGKKLMIDRITHLIWQIKGSENRMSYDKAKAYVAELNKTKHGGYNNWRLPTLEEAMSLMEPDKQGDLYINPKFDHEQRWIWTADKENRETVWVVSYVGGNCSSLDLDYDFYYVRAVHHL